MDPASELRLDYARQGLTDAVAQRRQHNDGSLLFKALPTEILRLIASGLAIHIEDIWQEDALDVQPGTTSEITPGLALSHTCSRWREVAVSIPEFWTIVPLSHAEWAQECLRRSQTLPIVLVSRATSDGVAADAAANHVNRARFIALNREDMHEEESWLTQPTPLLESMRLSFAYPFEMQSTLSRTLFGGQEPPRLKRLAVGRASLIQPEGSLVPFLWTRTLKSLSFYDCMVWRDVDDMVATLARVPALEELRIERSRILARVPDNWHTPEDVTSIHLPRLKDVWLNISAKQSVVVLRHINLPAALRTLSIRVNDEPGGNFAGINALIRLPLLPIIQEIVQQPLPSRRLEYFMCNQTWRLVANRPMSPDDILGELADHQNTLVHPPRDVASGPHLSLEFEHQPFMVGGHSTSALVATIVPPLYTAGALILDGPIDEIPLVADKDAWPSRLGWLRATEYLELRRGGALGFAFRADAQWLQRSRPSILCLRDVPLDTPMPLTDVEPPQTLTFFDILMKRIEWWIQIQSLKRVVLRQCSLHQRMLDQLEQAVGQGCVDWDQVVNGAGPVPNASA